MKNSAQTACFTGHRNVPQGKIEDIKAQLEVAIRQLIGKGYKTFLSGGAVGFDTLAAETVIRLRSEFPHIQLVVVQPCKNQDTKWNETDKARYNALLSQADSVVCLSDSYYDGCMKVRNKYLADNSSACVAYLLRERSGTAQTVRMCRENGSEIILAK
jgi:uncharacterized phage-like protein YoqJ